MTLTAQYMNSAKELYLSCNLFVDDFCQFCYVTFGIQYWCLNLLLNSDVILTGSFPESVKPCFVWTENFYVTLILFLSAQKSNNSAFASTRSQWIYRM